LAATDASSDDQIPRMTGSSLIGYLLIMVWLLGAVGAGSARSGG
jgi:hypothetical protein